MTNCLVTKLNGIVQNDFIPKLSDLIIDFRETTTTGNISIQFNTLNDGITIRVSNGDNRLICQSITGHSNPVNTLNITGTVTVTLVANANYNLYVSKIENIERIINRYSLTNMKYNLRGKVEAMTSIKELTINYAKDTDCETIYFNNPQVQVLAFGKTAISGRVIDMNAPKCNYFVTSNYITGAITDVLTTFPIISTLVVLDSILSGTIEDFCELMSSKNISRTITIRENNVFTFHGTVISTLKLAGYNDEPHVIRVYNGDNLLGTYDGSTWTYNS